MISYILLILAGFGEGLLVAGALMLLISLLDILPRISLISGTNWSMAVWVGCFSAGLMVSCLGSLLGLTFSLPQWTNVIAFLFFGMYVGVFFTALAETLDLFPASLGKLVPTKMVKAVLAMLVIGKVAGSLLYWLMPQLWR